MAPRPNPSTPALRRALTWRASFWRDLVIAFAGVGVCTGIRLLLRPQLNSQDVFTTYFPAVMFAGAFAGTRAMLIALATSGLIVWWTFIPPPYSFAIKTPQDLAALCTFFGASGVVGAFAAYLRRTLIQLWEARDAQQRMADELLRRAAEAQAGEARFRALAESIPGLVAEGAQGRITFASTLFQTFSGLSELELGEGWKQLVHPDDRQRAFAAGVEAVRVAGPQQIECRLRRADGVWRWFLARWAPIRDAQGRVEKWVTVSVDITEQREAADLQRALLQEVSHRVKNSLALVSSLLRLQARPIEGAARHALEEAALRVHAVARVHDLLWRRAGTREIELKPFLSDLCAAVAASAPGHQTVCRLEAAVVSSDFAVPLGLLVNELLTNAYKYAYPGEAGEVRLRGTRERGERYRLEVEDSGVGLPPGFDLAAARESLGMKVITSLTAQLGGELTAERADPGARFTLRFPLELNRKAGA